jgi:hypothetical protein
VADPTVEGFRRKSDHGERADLLQLVGRHWKKVGVFV